MPRKRLVRHLKLRLEREGYPRLQMLFLVLITGGSGFLASVSLLHLGLSMMSMRYLLAFLVAYGVFLLLLWLWLRTSAEDYLDAPSDLPQFNSGPDLPSFSGDGGSFGGGGASADFDSAYIPDNAMGSGTDGLDDIAGEAFGAAAEAEEFAIPLIVLLLVVSLLLSSLWIVYSAPMLFAELMLDGVLVSTLYRRLRRLEQRHWLETAVRRTIWPMVLTAIMLTACGWGMQHYAPEAVSLGGVLQHHLLQ